MPSTIDIRRRIRSVRNTQQITKAMKMVAAARLRRAQERIFAARPYAAALREVLASVAARVDVEHHPLLEQREEKKVLLLVITADRGLCGAFNANAIKAAMNAMKDHREWESVQLIPIGRKANDFFKRRAIPIRRQATQIFQALSLDTAREIASTLIDDFTAGEVDAVYAVFNEYRSIISQITRLERLLPIERAWDGEAAAVEYLYEPTPAEILNDLLPKHVEFQLYRMLLESAAAEQGARMTAMESATKNATEMIAHLTLTYNRIRQAAITKEIIEIVSGASAQEA
ncbi:MAG TPA: ATP synthase F1 subunit gamma [Thermoanaerobaculia bacterium]|nr:ATP synthase F1 subunit gamma [Thermoanaerobaculia bacterium]